MTARLWLVLALAAAGLAWPREAAAQARPTTAPSAVRARSLELIGGGVWAGGITFGDRPADLTSNQTTGGTTTLFRTSGELAASPGFEGRVAFNFTRTFAVEGGVTWTRPAARVRVSGDFEGAADVTATETLSQYVFDVSAVVHLNGLAFGGGGVPYVIGGGGYLRHLHEGQTLVEEGQAYHVGGGVKYYFVRRAKGLIRRLGARGDARYYWRLGGYDLDPDEPVRSYASVAGSFILGF